MQDFRNLRVWQKAHALTLAVYAESAKLPKGIGWGLQSQLVRAATSIPANIAEGCGRAGDRDFRRFLRHSLGSACELEYHLLLARDLDFLSTRVHESLDGQVVEVKRMLAGLVRRLGSDEQLANTPGRS
jgi:four helix bundle protein